MRNFFILSLLIVLSDYAQPVKAEVIPQQIVQQFYNWYVPIAAKDHTEPVFMIALKSRASLFSSELINALKEDATAQAKTQGEIVGLDWDPFLNTQDQADRYEVGKVTKKSDRTLVEVYGLRSTKKSSKPDVIVELARNSGEWLFINFRFTNGGDLLSVLKSLRVSRQKDSRS